MQTVRARPSMKAGSKSVRSRAAAVKPVAALNMKAVAAGVATAAGVAVIASAPAEAANLLSTVASASEGYPFVPPSWAPSVLVPFTGLVLPAVAMATLFNYIQADAPEK